MEQELQSRTESGGFITVVISLVLCYLLLSEFIQYRTVHQDFEFIVDHSRGHDLELLVNIDLTVAMKCDQVRLDVLDVAKTVVPVTQSIQLEPVIGLI